MRISVLSTTDSLVRDIAALSLSDLCAIIDIHLGETFTELTLGYPDGREEHVIVPLAHSCITCSLREAIIPLLIEHSGDLSEVLLVLPSAVESTSIVPTLVNEAGGKGLVVSSVIHVSDLSTVTQDILGHVPLSERGLALFPEDDRCLGEVLLMDLGYADLIVALGAAPDSLAADLVEHFRPHDTLKLSSLSQVTGELLFGGIHDVDRSITQVHPVTTRAWGSPIDRGVWTLDLQSDRPFHPQRLSEAIADLSPDGVCVRGCFWLPTRPHLVCSWNAHGGSVTVGTVGEWEDYAVTHLIVTGIGLENIGIERAFAAALMTKSEMMGILEWVGKGDDFDHWFAD